MNSYKALDQQVFTRDEYSLVPIRLQDRYDIMKWRNEQMYHLRQARPLTKGAQDKYFEEVVSKLFDKDQPEQLLFSFLKNDKCVGYGGLVHINWYDKNAEISFIMETALEEEYFEVNWSVFLKLIEKVAFIELDLHKIITYAFDLRPRLYNVLETEGFGKEARLEGHCYFENKFINVLIHCKFNPSLIIRAEEKHLDVTFKWANDKQVRTFSFNQGHIDFDHHKEWFLGKIKSKSCNYYILKYGNIPVGSIRFDVEENSTAKISYLLDPNYTGKGLGYYILKFGTQSLKKDNSGIEKVYGFVLPKNKASVRIFEKLGYNKMIKEDQIKFEKTLF